MRDDSLLSETFTAGIVCGNAGFIGGSESALSLPFK
jgi:hypothetical protein